MKRILFLLVSVFTALSVFSADQFYVIMKDGSVESYPTDKVDSITFDDPKIEKILGFNELAARVVKLEKEIEDLKGSSGAGGTVSTCPISGYVDGYAYVDLGLPSGKKWATMNVGATKENDYGDYYAWGEVYTSSNYSESNCKAYGKSVSSLKTSGVIGENGNLTLEYDAATQNWGENWRMPTKAEFDELIENCTWTWTRIGGNFGYKVVSNQTGNCNWIFLPAAGLRYGTTSSNVGSYGYYWSSAVNESLSDSAYSLYFYSSRKYTNDNCRFDGRSVRPVVK